MFKTDNSLHVFVGPNSTSADISFQNDVTIAASTGAGSVSVVHETGVAPGGALVAGDSFKVAQKHADGSVSFSPLVKFNDCTFKGGNTIARTEQNILFGSTGAAGSIQAINSNRYTLRVNFKGDTDMYSEQSDLHFFEYVSDANATEIEVADYFAQIMSKNEKFSGTRLGKRRGSVKVERLSDAADAAISTDINTMNVTNGSKVIDGVDFGSGTDITGMLVGSYLRIVEDGDVDTTPVDTTDAIYKIVSRDDTNNFIVLDQPFQGTSASLEDIAFQQITAAQAAAGSVGIKITGLAQEWKLGLFTDTVIMFDLTLDGFGDTTAAVNTAPAVGSGHGQQIAELEWFGKGSMGAPYRSGTPNNGDYISYYAVSTASYDVVECDCKMLDPNHAVAGSGVSRTKIVIALTDDVNQTDGAQANTTFGLTAIFNAA